MRKIFVAFPIVTLFLAAVAGPAATLTGTVTNKTNNKPSAGDAVDLIDVQAGMADVAHATTDASGRYTINAPGVGSYLVRVNHQGGTYFIAAPQGGTAGDVNVYDVAAKVEGVSIDADMLLIEAVSGILHVHERFLIRNTSLPPRAQYSSNTFEVVLPSGAELDSASTTRPGGLATNTRLIPLSQKGHYTFNVPIQPNKGENETLFEVMYHISSYDGKFTFAPQLLMPADNLVVYLAKGIAFKAMSGVQFETRQEDPRVDTYVAKNLRPGQSVSFTISGEGQMPVQSGGGQSAMGSTAASSNAPGGGIGAPIGSPDPLTKYKWWILSALAIALIAAAAFLLCKGGNPSAMANAVQADTPLPERQNTPPHTVTTPIITPQSAKSKGHDELLGVLKDELFAIESQRLSGALSESEYLQMKAGLEAVLKRTLGPRD
jgi:hypothetical protein